MRTYIERTLVKIKRVMNEKGYLPSCDIYHDDLKDLFVVWIHSITKIADQHFRDKHLRTALRKAYKFVKEL